MRSGLKRWSEIEFGLALSRAGLQCCVLTDSCAF